MHAIIFVIMQDSIEAYTGKALSDMPPHIFAIAEAALRYYRTERKNQSCIISGESGAGKVRQNEKFLIIFFPPITADREHKVYTAVPVCRHL